MSRTRDAAPDTSEMLLVHRVFRREFGRAPDLVRAVPDRDQDRRLFVAGSIQSLLDGLERHHGGEDLLIWPKLLDRARLDEPLITRMTSQHEAVAIRVGEVAALLARWRGEPDPDVTATLAEALEGLREVLMVHLYDEETYILPLIGQHLTSAEWNEVGEHGRRDTPKSKLPLLIGALLHDASPAEQARILGKMPPPIRLFWRLAGQRIYRRHMRELTGKAP